MEKKPDTVYEFIKAIFLSNEKSIVYDLHLSKYPLSCQTLYFFQKKMEEFKMTLDSMKEELYYASQAILRIVLEHLIIAHYVFMKSQIEQNDECGSAYYEEYYISEFFKRQNYDLNIRNIALNKKEKQQILDVLKQAQPVFQNVTTKDLENINIIANQFDIKKILDYLTNKIQEGSAYRKMNESFILFVHDYNRVSSFVHGGPSAQLQAYDNTPRTDKLQAFNDAKDLARQAATMSKEYLLLLLSINDEKYRNLYEPIARFRETLLM